MEREECGSLENIAKKFKNSKKKTTLLYAFNGTGKTRLSMCFQDLVNPPKPSEKKTSNLLQCVYRRPFQLGE